jgi:hypothetical protein
MPDKKKKSVSLQPNVPNMNNMLRAAIAVITCIKKKCKHEQEQLKKNKYLIEAEQLLLDVKNGKRDMNTVMKKVAELKIKVIEEKYRDELIACQLKDCYKETLNAMKSSIEGILATTKKDTDDYKIACRYKIIFAKSKITQQHIDNLEIEVMKLKMKKMEGYL